MVVAPKDPMHLAAPPKDAEVWWDRPTLVSAAVQLISVLSESESLS